LRSNNYYLGEEKIKEIQIEVKWYNKLKVCGSESNSVDSQKLDMIMKNLKSTFVRDDCEKIIEAFKILDTEKAGYLTIEQLKDYMSREEVFSNGNHCLTKEEIQEMINEASDSIDQKIYYEKYAIKLADS
jgi:Ca2+-binding EF-hand superfamily protein